MNSLEFRSYALSDVGRRRKINEDAALADDALGLWVVADGVGGHKAGEVASNTAVEVVSGQIRDGVKRSPSLAPESACRMLESAVQAATYMVFGMAELDAKTDGMGTTLSVLFRVDDEHAAIAQVGDSRIYRVRGGRAEQLTEDHTLVNWQLQQGLIGAAEARVSKRRNVILRAVGSQDYVNADTRIVDVREGDRFVLCTDGLHGLIADDEVAAACRMPGQEAVEWYVREANDRGGSDNITVVLVTVEPSRA